MDDLEVIDEIQKLQQKMKTGQLGRSCLLRVSHNPNFLFVSLRNEVMRQESWVNIVLALNKLTVQSPTKKTDNEN